MGELIVVFIGLLFPFVIPTYSAWTHPNWKGVVLGAVTLWLFLFFALVLLIDRYGTGGPAALMTGLWALTGWLWSILYCALVCVVRRGASS